MPLKICCKNIVKMGCTYHFLKKKWKKKSVKCGNGIVENGGKKGYEICEIVKKKKLSCPQYFYNIFTINHT